MYLKFGSVHRVAIDQEIATFVSGILLKEPFLREMSEGRSFSQRFAQFLLRILGWTVNYDFPEESRHSVVIAAPHTTNWDGFYIIAGMRALGIPLKFTIKNSITKIPIFGSFMKGLGAIGIDRTKKSVANRSTQSDMMADILKTRKNIALAVAAEGTRSLRQRWKMGFYRIAMDAGVPICFGYLDYEKKEAGIGGMIMPTGDVEADMKVISDFYRDIKGKYPEKFSLDERYS